MKAMLDRYCKYQSLLCLGVLAGCAADSGAVSKPLVFESSAKRAAAIKGGAQAGAGAEAGAPASASSTKTVAPPPSGGSAGAGAAMPATSAMTKPPAGAMAPAAAGSSAAQKGAAGSPVGMQGMQPSAAGSMAAAAGAAATQGGSSSGGATPCTMTVTYNAVGMHGMWYPHNIGALWVEDENGKFVKTLERWAGIRAGYLSRWNMREDQHGTWPSCPFANVCTGPMVPDQMDVMSQATIFEDNAMHMAKWSCKNIAGEVVPDGKYKLFFEEMENIYPTFPEGPLGMVEFEKGSSAATLMPPDMAPYKNLKIVIEPTAR